MNALAEENESEALQPLVSDVITQQPAAEADSGENPEASPVEVQEANQDNGPAGIQGENPVEVQEEDLAEIQGEDPTEDQEEVQMESPTKEELETEELPAEIETESRNRD
jgi:hypothetical protein